MQEVILALGETLSQDIVSDMQASPFFSLCVDESTDVAVTKQLIVYGRYLVGGTVKTSFLGILELPNGVATTITDTLCKFCADLNLDLHKLCALGSDGAAVMLGVRGGVSKLLKDKVSYLVGNHCVAHRLALACSQAAKEILYFKDILGQLYRFYENSLVRYAGLKAIQDLLCDPQLKLTQAKDVRRLSHDKAISHVRKCFPSVITSLEREAEERHDALASGLSTFVKTYNFVAGLYMFSDVLPSLANLSRAFQKKDIHFSMILR